VYGYEQQFPTSVRNAQAGQAPGKDAWGATGYRSSILEDKKNLAALHPAPGAAPALLYEDLAMDLYTESTDALAAGAEAGGVAQQSLIQQALRLELLGDRVFDRGREIENLASLHPGSLTLPSAIPDFAGRDLGPTGSALAPGEEKALTARAWRRVVQQAARAVPPAVRLRDRAQLNSFVINLGATVEGSACLTGVGRALRDGVAVAGEAALVARHQAGPRALALAESLTNTSVSIWNDAAAIGGVPKLPVAPAGSAS
jgi:hypothetical protein